MKCLITNHNIHYQKDIRSVFGEKMKWIKSIVLLLLVPVLASCQLGKPTDTKTENEATGGTGHYVPSENELLLIANEQAYCAVVYPADASQERKEACVDLAQAIRKHTGVNVKRYSDAGTIPDGIIPILIGDVNHPETAQVKAGLDRFEYSVSVVNGKVVVVGFDEEMTDSAILYFSEMLDDSPERLRQGVWSLPLNYSLKCEGKQKKMLNLKLSALGDSYFGGAGIGQDNVWVSLLAKKYNMAKYIDGVGGATVTNALTDPVPHVERYQNVRNGSNIVLLEGGRNDYLQQVPIGETGSHDVKTFIGAWNVIVDGIKAKCPNAMIVMISPWNFPNQESRPITREQYINAMRQVAEQQGIYFIDASDTSLTGVDMTNATFREQYCVKPSDVSHLNAEGMKLVVPNFEKILIEYYNDFLSKK